MAKTKGVRALLVLVLATGCGGAHATTQTTTATEPSSGNAGTGLARDPITSGSTSGGSGTRTLTQAEFNAQWADPGRSSGRAPMDFGGLGIRGAPRGPDPYAAYGGMGYDIEHPIAVCGPGESYVLVASHVCPDGSVPLGGALSAGAGARLGNVGANATGHIIDLYEVPCASGPVQLFVDMYGCPGGTPF